MEQLDYGIACYTGKGTQKDPLEAYAWFYVATSQGVKNAHKNKIAIYNQLLPDEKKQATQLAYDFINKYSPK